MVWVVYETQIAHSNMQKSHKSAHYSMQYGISTWIFVLYSQLQETAISETAVSQLQI